LNLDSLIFSRSSLASTLAAFLTTFLELCLSVSDSPDDSDPDPEDDEGDEEEDDLLLFLVRSAVLGLVASSVSDCVSNSLRVIKTTKQTAGLGDGAGGEITYREALALVLETDGIVGLFGRGLQTRLLTNAIQGAVFSVLWKYFQSMQS